MVVDLCNIFLDFWSGEGFMVKVALSEMYNK